MRLFLCFFALGCTDKTPPVDDSEAPVDDSGDTGVDPAWAHCPGADAFGGDPQWPGLAVASDARYCALPNEERTLQGELVAKSQLRVVDGSYPLPVEESGYALTLPVCVLRADPQDQPAMAGYGQTEVSVTNFGGSTYTYLTGAQPMAAPDLGAWTLAHTLVLAGETGSAPEPLLLDGGGPDLSTGASATFILYENSGTEFDAEAMTFAPCDDASWVRNIHTFTFDGGELRLTLAIGTDNIITAASQFLEAEGSIDGVTFDIADYFRLIYRPGHHHYTRDFAVILDAPVGDVCALLVEGADGQPETSTATVRTADCALNPLGSRAVSDEGWSTE